MSQIDVWCQMPELSSSRQGEYVATPVVAQIRNFDEDKLRPSQGEVASVFTGVQRYLEGVPKKWDQWEIVTEGHWVELE